MLIKNFLKNGGRSYKDPFYEKTDLEASRITGVPLQVLRAVRLAEEQSNEDQVADSTKAAGVYQFIPSTRNAVLRKYGVDAWKPEQASLAAAYLLKESADRNKGDYSLAIREYHGGLKRENWGKYNREYDQRTQAFLKSSDNSTPSHENVQSYSGTPLPTRKPLEMVDMLNHGNQDWLAENIRLQQEISQQKQLDIENEELQAQIALQYQQEQKQKQDILKMIPRAEYTPQEMKKGGYLDNVDSDVKGFYNEISQLFPGLRVTSGYRPGAKTKSGKASRHSLGQALDMAPHPDLHKFLYTKQGDSLLRKYGLGFLDETISDNLKATGGTGAHIHIGKDSTLKGNTSKRNTAFSRQSLDDYYPETPGTDVLTQYQNVDPFYLNEVNQQRMSDMLIAQNEALRQEQVQQQEQSVFQQIQAQIQSEQQRKKQILQMIPQAEYTPEQEEAVFRQGGLFSTFNPNEY